MNEKTKRILFLLLNTKKTQSEIARELKVSRQRVYQVRQEIDKNPYAGFDGTKLTARREAKAWSMSELARKLAVSTSQVSRWESGEQTPWPSTWRQIARLFGSRVEDFEKDEVMVNE